MPLKDKEKNREYHRAYHKARYIKKGFNPSCLRTAFKKGHKLTPEQLEKRKLQVRGTNNPFYGKKHSIETKLKWSAKRSGSNSFFWIEDRTQLKKSDDKSGSAYAEWRKDVYVRDKYKCRIANQDCKGRIEAHHILPWRDFIELRYEVNNGITLCHAHHPIKRAEEKELIPVFQRLVALS